MVAALEEAVAVRGHEGEQTGLGTRHGVDDERCGLGGEPAQPALLPAPDHPPHGVVVFDGGTRGRERETTARALAAARDGPDGRRPAAGAERRDDRRQPVATGIAQLRPGTPAGEAALREEEVEQAPTLAGKV